MWSSQIKTWGNSQGLRLPKELLSMLSLKTDDYVSIEVSDSKIIISKTYPHRLLEERMEAAGLHEMPDYNEFEWGEPVGREFW